MKRINFTLLILLIFQFSLLAQEYQSISGKIMDTDGTPLINAAVIFSNTVDSTQSYPAVCDVNGFFQTVLSTGKYSFYISYMGAKYNPQNNEIVVASNDLDLKVISIKVAAFELDEFTVVAKKPFVSYRGNTSVYNLSANPALIGGNLLEGIKHLPGIQVRDDNKLSVYGFYDLTVVVNHQLLNLTKEEIIMYLSSMSVEDVEKVEIIRNPGPEYGRQVDAVLNIVTKQKVDDGVNAFLSTGVSYQKSLSENISSRININKSITKSYLSYNFSQIRKHETLTTDIGIDSISILPRNAHQLQLGSDIAISTNHTIGLRGVLSLTKEHFINNKIRTVDLNQKSFSANLHNNMSGKKWRWNTNIDIANNLSNRDYFYIDVLNTSQKDDFGHFRVSTNFLYKLTTSLSTQVGSIWYKTNYKTSLTENKLNIGYNESNIAAFISFHYRKNKIDANGGLQINCDNRIIDFSENNSTSYPKIWNYQPFFNIDYNAAANHRLSLAFSTYYNRPAFRDILPYTSSSSSFLNRIGNPDLTNSTRNNLALTYTFMRAAIFEVSFSDERNPIVEYITKRDDSFMLTKTNLTKSQYSRVLVGLPVPIVKTDNSQWLVSTYFAYHHQRDKGLINNEIYDKNFNAYYVQHKHSLYLPSQWYIDAQVTYFSPLFFGIYKTEQQWWVDFNISKRVDNWKFTLTGYDIFNTNIAKGELNGQSQKMHFTKNWHSPKITFGISLTLGNKSLKIYKDRQQINVEKRINQNVDESISLNNK